KEVIMGRWWRHFQPRCYALDARSSTGALPANSRATYVGLGERWAGQPARIPRLSARSEQGLLKRRQCVGHAGPRGALGKAQGRDGLAPQVPRPATPKAAGDDARDIARHAGLLTRSVSRKKSTRSFPVDAVVPAAYQCAQAAGMSLGNRGRLRALNGASSVGPQRAVSA